ncbi:hypothetical protein B6N60_05270 [Richelia sinica FACHB-800]|uniref:Uncharacterized protein n=1 Tax=Richelia sinica FACHB-800 TaxID=1357546 RepID=A0A975TE60_9NOST|nr:hypothetical protein [Richelia sinica]MBD2665544.1 hypothetical protein [Richelia sinica FACHB-800]QXE26537.1 hypothetical protein B6N60_05270 [Richelia sinica FACHB-800]
MRQSVKLCASLDPLKTRDWYRDDSLYQILLVTPRAQNNSHQVPPGPHIETTIVTKTRGEFSSSEYQLDYSSVRKLKKLEYPRVGDPEKIGSYLPSPGSVLANGFVQALAAEQSSDENDYASVELNNFYSPIRNLLQTRQMSQLIAKTWDAYLEANKDHRYIWNQFTNGQWNNIQFDLLDGLVAREIFLITPNYPPDHLIPDNLDPYYPLKPKQDPDEASRLLILPSSLAWQGIALSLLLAGQAYYKLGEPGQEQYHQIYPPILSTGEIVTEYSLEVSWNIFQGNVREMSTSPTSNSLAARVVFPYPPIPSELNLPAQHIKTWAYASDKDGDIPFYDQTDDGKYLVNVLYYTPPYPYIPLSSCS